MIKVLVVDDHKMTRVGIKLSIEQDPEIRVIAEAYDANEGIALCTSLSPDIVLMDLNLPGLTGIEAIKTIVSNTARPKIIVFTGTGSKREIQDALLAGANGFCLKDISYNNLIAAIKSVTSGETWIDPSFGIKIPELGVSGKKSQQVNRSYDLSDREIQVLALVVEGKTNQEIASTMNLSVDTTKSHLGKIMIKLGVTDRTQAAVKAVREGLV